MHEFPLFVGRWCEHYIHLSFRELKLVNPEDPRNAASSRPYHGIINKGIKCITIRRNCHICMEAFRDGSHIILPLTPPCRWYEGPLSALSAASPVPPHPARAGHTRSFGLGGLLQLGLAPFLLLCFPCSFAFPAVIHPASAMASLHHRPLLLLLLKDAIGAGWNQRTHTSPSLSFPPSLPFDAAYWLSHRQTRQIRKGQLLIDDESRKLGFTHKSCNGSGVFTVFTDGAFRCSRLWGF